MLSDTLGKPDGENRHGERHERKPVCQEAVTRGRPGFRIEPHGRRREVGVVEDDEDGDHRRSLQLDRQRVRLHHEQQRQREPTANKQQVDDGMKEDAAEGWEPERRAHHRPGQARAPIDAG